MRTSLLTIFSLAVAATFAPAAPLTWPQGYVPFSAVYYRSSAPLSPGVYRGNNQIVSGLTTTGEQFAELTQYLRSLPDIADRELYVNNPIELAPGVFFTNVLVPTVAERQGDFGSDAESFGSVTDPYNGNPFPGGIIVADRLFGTFAFRLGGADPVTVAAAPEPGGALPVVLGTIVLVGIALPRRLPLRFVKSASLNSSGSSMGPHSCGN